MPGGYGIKALLEQADAWDTLEETEPGCWEMGPAFASAWGGMKPASLAGDVLSVGLRSDRSLTRDTHSEGAR